MSGPERGVRGGPLIDRRTLLKGAAASSVAALAPRWAHAREATGPAPFLHGVASGDPLPDAVIIWTRYSPDHPAERPRPIRWEAARDIAMNDVIARGTTFAEPERDWTVKIDVAGLSPGTTYYYRFTDLPTGRQSLTGRTKTAPTGSPENVRLAFVSCSNYRTGWFNPYARLARRADIDCVLHLGDYFYETGGPANNPIAGRTHSPNRETISLDDYRARYGQYRSDPDLIGAHQQHPWIVVWDDHESANNSWKTGARNHNEGEGDWEQRKRLAVQAYREWMPIRWPDDSDDVRIWRRFGFGDLADLIMLDTRLWGRNEGDTPTGTFGSDADDPTRTMLGQQQYEWLTTMLADSKQRGVAWRLVGQQTMISPHRNDPTNPPLPYLPPELLEGMPEGLRPRQGGGNEGSDNWGAYRVERDRLMAFLRDNGIANNAFLTGDIHTSWACDVVEDPYTPYHATSVVTGAPGYDPVTGLGSVGVELVSMSVSSNNYEESTDPTAPAQIAAFNTAIVAANPNVHYHDVAGHGYVLVDITRDALQGEWYETGSAHAHTPTRPEELAAAYVVRRGHAGMPLTNHLVPAASMTTARARVLPLVPNALP